MPAISSRRSIVPGCRFTISRTSRGPTTVPTSALTHLVSGTAHRSEWEVYYHSLYSSENAENLAMNTESVHELIDLCNDNHISLLIANVPELHCFEDYRFSYATDYIRGLAQETNVPFIDLLLPFSKFVPESLWVSPDDLHANEKPTRSSRARLEAE